MTKHTDETWFLHFRNNRGVFPDAKDSASIGTTNGSILMMIEAPHPSSRPDSAETRAKFRANVRIAFAGRALFEAMSDLKRAALEAGLPADHPALKKAEDAMVWADPPLHDVKHDGKDKFTGTHDECFEYIMQHQGQSVDYATKHGGWSITPVVPKAGPADDDVLELTEDMQPQGMRP